MKRLLLVLPFVLAACDSGVTTAPSESAAMAASKMSAKADAPTCTIGVTEYPRGFNENGYNYCARIFSGIADGVDTKLDGMVWGDPTYANDHLTMKWNAAWDACNDAPPSGPLHQAACTGAWTNNEWNGKVPGGSGVTEVVKMIWVGPCGSGDNFVAGGYCIWGEYEAIMDKGQDPSYGPGVQWFAHAKPTGYGSYGK